MAAPTTREEFFDLVRKSGVVDDKRLEAYLDKQRTVTSLPNEVGKLAGVLVRDGLLTQFQAEQFLLGKWRRFTIGKYKVLERLGSGGMGSVYLCEHKFMRRRVAVKVLPTAKAQESSALERFYREARAVAALDHPNIVRAYDIDQDDQLHFLVMEYIDGANLQEIVKRNGPLAVDRAAHYIRQAAQGLLHAHQTANLIHRDIKPGNILVDRNGIVKVLDMGLARFFNDDESCITAKYEENVLGTADYLAPEQALDSHNVDIRADIYSLGATFYFCLTGSTPFGEGSVAQKLIWHQTRQPKSVRLQRPEIPEEMAAVVEKMMAKDPAQRYASPAEVVAALEPWTREPIPPPPEKEMPRLSPAAQAPISSSDSKPGSSVTSGPASPAPTVPKWEGTPLQPRLRPTVATPLPTPDKVTAPVKRPGPTPAASPKPGPPAPVNGRASTSKPTPVPEAAPLTAEGSSPSWERVAPETDNPMAQLDTVRQPAASRSAQSSLARKRKPAPSLLEKWQQLDPRVKVSGLLGIGALGLIVLIWALLYKAAPPQELKESPRPQATTWYVTPTDQVNSFKSVREALVHAREGDRIVVQAERLEETLILEDGKRGKDVTIEAGYPSGRVRWLCPQVKDGYFVRIANLPGFRLKGFLFDGQNRARDLVVLEGSCPGLILDDIHLQGFNRWAIATWNCAGKNDKEPVILRNLRTIPKKEMESALVFNANPKVIPSLNQHLLIQDCRFEGPFKKAAVQVAGAALDVQLRHNRIFNCDDGVLYPKTTQAGPFQLTLDSNTFYQVQKTALHFEGVPLTSGESRVVIKNNLFAQTSQLAQVDEDPRKDAIHSILQPAGNVRDGTTKEGNLPLNAGVLANAVTLPTDADDDLRFLRYRASHPLARLGINQTPVGVPPVE
jgi:serine/threonine protein kinase